ncbi:pyridoxamine kinase [Mangrovibacterium marinum]|uniref:pyridoxal kinase n=1 Tax=Mangrovibacterium marinum TaxID=1639118 RepID=A0A2T5BYA4_9BACT|nr:pyridoxamine kinase [Mangrovibacterium marinum]PTN06794.1 pyridoxine kinase [Mangrovibacterium marinum]
MKNHLQRVAAIHDLSGFGRASLTVVIPILSSMGVQVCPLPTAVLSSHSAFPGFSGRELTNELPQMIQHWKELNIQFDAIYSGYLGAVGQIDLVKDFIDDFAVAGQLVIVDPVLGDNGKLYAAFNPPMVEKMRELVSKAEVITPNLTEAAFLLGEPYRPQVSIAELKSWCVRLSELGPQQVIITSVPEEALPNKTSVIAYNAEDKRYWRVSCDYLPANYPGTGDAFASVMVGALLQGDSLPIALDRAVHFISMGVRATFGHDHLPAEGILIEKVLPSLNAPVQISSYQLLD